MCFDIRTQMGKMDAMNEQYGTVSLDREQLQEFYQVSGFSHPPLPVLASDRPHDVQFIPWGFVPFWAKPDKAKQARFTTLNSRDSTIREKLQASGRNYQKDMVARPCVILADGFYEWHTLENGDKVPYLIYLKSGDTFPIAGFVGQWNDYADKARVNQGVTLCTTSANQLLGHIHNKPAKSEDLRMPVILSPGDIRTWLDTEVPVADRMELARPFPADAMAAHSVVNFKKKATMLGNVPEATAPFDYCVPEVPVRLLGENFA